MIKNENVIQGLKREWRGLSIFRKFWRVKIKLGEWKGY